MLRTLLPLGREMARLRKARLEIYRLQCRGGEGVINYSTAIPAALKRLAADEAVELAARPPHRIDWGITEDDDDDDID